MTQAVGIVEVYGLAAAFAALDAGCKAGNVIAETFDKNKPKNPDGLTVPLIVAVKFRGTVDSVTAAVAAAEVAANEVSGVITKHIIARPEDDTNKMLAISGLDKK